MTHIPHPSSDADADADADDTDPFPPDGLEQFKNLCPLLEQLGIATVTIEYNGAGDEGTIEPIVFEPPLPLVPAGLEDSLEEAVLAQLNPGWEINEGSCGTFILHVAARRLSHRQEWLESVSEDTELEL